MPADLMNPLLSAQRLIHCLGRRMRARVVLLVTAGALGALGACASPPMTPPVSNSTPVVAASSPSSPTPSATASPAAPLPAALPNGWIYEPRIDASIKAIVEAYNEVFPDAEFVGAGYRHPSVNHGSVITFIGQGNADPSIFFHIAGTDSKLQQLGLHTVCATAREKDPVATVACMTQTTPVVGMYFIPADDSRRDMTPNSLKDLAQTVQAEL